MSSSNTWRVYANGDNRSLKRCYLCRGRFPMLIVGGHTLPPAKKPGCAGGVKRLGLCQSCALAMAREAVRR